ncbi:ABC transporter permease [bacterium]|nr:ABC transporter permease [bacterium]
MIALRLAYRNLRRNRRRTVLTASALTVGLIVLITMMGMLDGIDSQSIDNLIYYDLAHVKGFADGYLDEDFPDLEHTIPHADSLLNIVRNLSGISAATERLEIIGMLIQGSEEVFVRIIGVDPAQDTDVFRTLEAVRSGLTISTDEPVALIGDRLASDLSLNVGDVITLLVRSAPGAFNPKMLPIAGIISTGHPAVDRMTVYVPLAVARDMTLLPEGATEIAIMASKLTYSKRLMDKLTQILPQLEWRSWQTLADDFIQLARMKRTGNGIIIGIIILVAAIGLGNTMIMSIHERTREIGALRALGFNSGLIWRIFVLEGFLIGLFAGIIAVVIGVAILVYLGHTGISLAGYGDMDIGYPVRDAIYPIVNVASVAMSFVFGLVISVLASWGAARHAARGQIVRALREGML